MHISTILITIFSNLLLLVAAKSKWYDGDDRPYEFGFSIEGNQHRRESKDANGIIMGEFGFLTADGVYHVTVYATDENGNFKVLSMKNLRKMETMVKQMISTVQQIKPLSPVQPLLSTTPQPFKVISTVAPVLQNTPKPSKIAACSNCFIPQPIVPPAQPPSASFQQFPTSKPNPSINAFNQNNNPQVQTFFTTTQNPNQVSQQNYKPFQQTIGAVGAKPFTPTNQGQVQQSFFNTPNQGSNFNNFGGINTNSVPETSTSAPIPSFNVPNQQSQVPQNFQSNFPSAPQQPQLSAQNVYNKGVSNQEVNAMTQLLQGLLYKFNYTVGYHGHREQGDRNGNKEGEYFVVGRDGIQRTVTYTADETGFHPKIQEQPVSEQETPREETEKEAGLKGYEFKWFYLDDNKRK